MDFTREPIIQTIITPREGYKLVVRSSKNMGQEEHFIDALEVVSFGEASFFRSTERPKPFLVPVSDYEVVEVREQRLVLKTAVAEGSVKIGNGRDAGMKGREEPKREARREMPAESEKAEAPEVRQPGSPAGGDGRSGRRDRRRGFRRRRGGGGGQPRDEAEAQQQFAEQMAEDPQINTVPSSEPVTEQPVMRSVLAPPSTLIRDDLQRLRENYQEAFFIREEGREVDDDDESLQSAMRENEQVHMYNEPRRASFEEEPFLFTSATENEPKRDSQTDLP